MKIGQTWTLCDGHLVTITNIGDGYIEYMDMYGAELWVNAFNNVVPESMHLYVAKGQIWQLEAPSLGKSNKVIIEKVDHVTTKNINFIRENGDIGRITMALFEQIANRIE